ncbi:hypothetical protein C8246_04880 [Paracidovorax avenae]|uniref:hypothetical protein n=1 Tax=Paracidovorax avenae TaxID=80867 RepID=UPI000D16291E|nr:hypothetical protein [Paracidovorax avenae]AVS77661.1 hypothetical protein C8234_05935 [Paracidovorax avenae]AVS91253.1 hypothetical protein C8246_04880 [Paracidovorax avenae]AVT16188.1 hypothetical protein C8244_08215 [Paracidovorax avenae]AVT20119.1 hypothetical protein C7Y68_08955 [Paracidovorax avenae]
MKNSPRLEKICAILAYSMLPLAAAFTAPANAQKVIHTDLINRVPAAKSLSVRGPNLSGCYPLPLGQSVLGPDIVTNTRGNYLLVAMREPGCFGGDRNRINGLSTPLAISGDNEGRLTIEITPQGFVFH